MVDTMVLKAQQWVNSTYAAVSGYSACPEDGKTGWSVMHSLTRALQHELGITTLSDGFGPTTTSKLDAHGPIGSGESNKNLIKIIQSACYCKGYDAWAIDGNWSGADAGVSRMMNDLGLGSAYAGKVTTKMFRALLTMDAYVLLSGGSQEVRTIQQWLNQRYWTRSWFNIIPTEGHYSRDVQKALMMALQSEMGIADSSVTGNFGPATQSGLRAHQLSQGATGIFVQLLSAACVFNGTVVDLKGTSTHTIFKDTFDAPLAQYLTAFQQFSKLPAVNGQADYGTWCQLLVSCGDPDRTNVGACDTRFTITLDLAKAMKNSGYSVVGRYLDEPATSTLNKEIQPGELNAIFDGGLRVFPIWQYNARELADFSYASGSADGARAHDRMVYYGFNPGAVIYFAVDYDALDEEITSNILPYLRGVQSALVARGRKYLAGVYGSRNVCIRATNEAQIASSFVSGMSWGFSGNLGFPLPYNWAFNQVKEFSYTGGGQTIDLDRDVHRPEVDRGVGRDGVGGGQTSSPLSLMMDFVDQVWSLAVSYGGDPNQRVMEYLRAPRYTRQYGGWDMLLGQWDQDWIDYATSRLGPARITFPDPSTGETLHLDHLAATADAVYLKGSGSGTAVTRGDFGGWGGDLTTFYGDWRNNTSTWKSGYAFCKDNLATRGGAFSFSYSDLAEDADGYLIGTACKAGAKFSEQFRLHEGGSGQATRFKQLWTKRFGASKATATGAARTMLCADGPDDTLTTLRDLALLKQAGPIALRPKELDAAELQLFLDGFADTVSNLAITG
jgi:peptidoglycan hydrolase-like protein with peptidoglycan-binding domain